MSSAYEKATFAAGCFWGVEEDFRHVPGVVDTAVGYEGGTLEHPTYEDVCTDRTGHAEAVEVTFDPAKVSYEELVGVFFRIHDPTQLNRQGPDVGTQYRSAIFVHSEEQRRVAEEAIRRLERERVFRRPVVTAVEPATTFWRAEDYHQRYLARRGGSRGPVRSG
jgi:peptide-methionine (S)-S-oxide reductase